MLPKYWIAFLLTIWISRSCSAEEASKAPTSAARCSVVSPFDSPFVSAYLTHFTPGKGCTSNVTSPSLQEVHVLNLKLGDKVVMEKRMQVSLRVEPHNSQKSDQNDGYDEYRHPLVFVLASEQPVKWKVELVGIPQMRTKHIFMVPRHSSIRFKKSKVRKQVKGRKVNMPVTAGRDEFAAWVKNRFKVMTSYSEVEGTSLLFRVGLDPHAGSDCNLIQLSESPQALTSYMEFQPVSGCVTQGRKHFLARPVYIIELEKAPNMSIGDREIGMELEVTSADNEPINKDFYLILKSPSTLKWDVRSRKVMGWIDIVTDAEVDLKRIRMHTVALRREVMKDSGEDLIKWAEYYIAPVESYVRVPTANRIKLLLSPNEKRVDPTDTPEENYHEVKDHLKGIHADCTEGMMEIPIPIYIVRQLALVKEQITLLDPSCGAVENSTHITLKTRLNSCRTTFLQVDEENVYSNAIVIHAPGMADILMEEFGSAFLEASEMSGSGSHDLNGGTYVDDEDFQSHSVEIDVQCKVQSSPTVNSVGAVNYHLVLFRHKTFLRPIPEFPMTCTKNSRLFVQMSVSADPMLQLQVNNCWLSQTKIADDTEKYFLIKNGCSVEDTVKWHNQLDTNRLFNNLHSFSRFSFVVREFFPHGHFVYIHGEVSLCRRSEQGDPSVPRCLASREKYCKKLADNETPLLPTKPCHRKVLVEGPWQVTDREVTIHIPTKANTDLREPNQKNPSKVDLENKSGKVPTNIDPQEGSTQPQQSVIIEGLDSATVVGIAFAAFAIGILLTGALWFIHTHTGPSKRGITTQGSAETSGESTPNSSSPISA